MLCVKLLFYLCFCSFLMSAQDSCNNHFIGYFTAGRRLVLEHSFISRSFQICFASPMGELTLQGKIQSAPFEGSHAEGSLLAPGKQKAQHPRVCDYTLVDENTIRCQFYVFII